MNTISKLITLVALSLGLVLPALPGAAEETDAQGLVSFEDKASYSAGHKMGLRLKGKTELETDPFVRGIRDAMSGSEPLLSAEEMTEVLETHKSRRQKERERQFAEMAKNNLQEGEKFLAENATKEGVTVLPSGLQYRVLDSGTGKTPGEKDRVTARYRGTFVDGTEFGNTLTQGDPVTFDVEGVIPGWAEALQLMKEGDKWRLFLPANLAYGKEGRMPRIEPNKALVFDVELIAVMPAEVPAGAPAGEPQQASTED